jgi:hypothetical protein
MFTLYFAMTMVIGGLDSCSRSAVIVTLLSPTVEGG